MQKVLALNVIGCVLLFAAHSNKSMNSGAGLPCALSISPFEQKVLKYALDTLGCQAIIQHMNWPVAEIEQNELTDVEECTPHLVLELYQSDDTADELNALMRAAIEAKKQLLNKSLWLAVLDMHPVDILDFLSEINKKELGYIKIENNSYVGTIYRDNAPAKRLGLRSYRNNALAEQLVLRSYRNNAPAEQLVLRSYFYDKSYLYKAIKERLQS